MGLSVNSKRCNRLAISLGDEMSGYRSFDPTVAEGLSESQLQPVHPNAAHGCEVCFMNVGVSPSFRPSFVNYLDWVAVCQAFV